MIPGARVWGKHMCGHPIPDGIIPGLPPHVPDRGRMSARFPLVGETSRLYPRESKSPIGMHASPSPLITRDGIRFAGATDGHITEVPEYWMDDIGPGDRVLDVGANIGAFSLRAARLSPHIVAVEPVTTGLLAENIRENNAPVRVIRAALGDGSPVVIAWNGEVVTIPTHPLRDLVRMAGGCDFLKCDAEGAEWLIDPPDLAGIRRIEMELHQPPIGGPASPALLAYIGREYAFAIDRIPAHGPLGQMGILHAWREDQS